MRARLTRIKERGEGMKKNYDGWAVKTPDGKLLPRTCDRTKEGAIDLLISGQQVFSYGWPDYHKRGYRCVKVRLVEVER